MSIIKVLSEYNKPDDFSVFKKDGFLIIDNFLPIDEANKLEKLYSSEKSWDIMDQVREKHYSHVFKMDSQTFPQKDEIYSARFQRSNTLEKEIDEIFKRFFKPTLNELAKSDLLEFDVRCYKLGEGDFYRTHMDDYAGTIGCVYYLNKRWCWDWGGILHIGKEDDSLSSIFPKFNRIVVHDMKKFRFPHFISPVTNYAKSDRYTIVSFNK